MGLDLDFIEHLYSEFNAIGNVAHGKPPHILPYDGLWHEQAAPRSLLWTLGGKAGVEDLAHDLVGYAAGVVGSGFIGDEKIQAPPDKFFIDNTINLIFERILYMFLFGEGCAVIT